MYSKNMSVDEQFFWYGLAGFILANWYWKFTGDNPAGDSIVFVAEIEKELVACLIKITC